MTEATPLPPVPAWKLGCLYVALGLGAGAVLLGIVMDLATGKPISIEPTPALDAGPTADAPREREPEFHEKVATVVGPSAEISEHAPSNHILIRFSIGTHFTKSLAASAAKIKTLDVLKVARSDRPGTSVSVSIFAPMVDKFGNSSESNVVTAMYSPETIQRINFDGINHANAWTIADKATVHSEFR